MSCLLLSSAGETQFIRCWENSPISQTCLSSSFQTVSGYGHPLSLWLTTSDFFRLLASARPIVERDERVTLYCASSPYWPTNQPISLVFIVNEGSYSGFYGI